MHCMERLRIYAFKVNGKQQGVPMFETRPLWSAASGRLNRRRRSRPEDLARKYYRHYGDILDGGLVSGISSTWSSTFERVSVPAVLNRPRLNSAAFFSAYQPLEKSQ